MHSGGFTPSNVALLKRRADMVRRMRGFFYERGYWECETSPLSVYGTSDLYVDSLKVTGADTGRDFGYLHTSPEYAMKRLLASGSGPIFQFCTVFRDDPVGNQHSPDFTMVEWYRTEFDYLQLMDEIDALLVNLAPEVCVMPADRISYRDVFLRYLGLDPFNTNVGELLNCTNQHGVNIDPASMGDHLDDWLTLVFGCVIEPMLNPGRFTFVFDFPASQASLAKVRNDFHAVAERFELFFRGTEIANGYTELIDADEQKKRFEQDIDLRSRLGKAALPVDASLVEALVHGLPECAGVALGVDRLIMALTGTDQITQVRSG